MNKIVIILGQTSTGKSDFAVEIAKMINGEIISADSRQVYKGLNIGSGKITKKEMHNIPHHLLDVISPKKIFSVSNFQKIVNKKILEITKRSKIPIICGGTGFYLDSISTNILYPEVPPNDRLRKKLSLKTELELFNYLEKLDKSRAKNIDPNNKVRLIRAIEIALTLGKVPVYRIKDRSDLSVIKIGLRIPNDELKKRIKLRLLSRIKKGMINEVKNLHEINKVSWKRLESFGLEYRYISLYLKEIKGKRRNEIKKIKEKMIENLNTMIWHFAKRQNTYFKRDKKIIWINPEKNREKIKIKKILSNFLIKKSI
jgi:tRNA dimethylallyltransferase